MKYYRIYQYMSTIICKKFCFNIYFHIKAARGSFVPTLWEEGCEDLVLSLAIVLLFAASVVGGAVLGRSAEVGAALLTGASDAVRLGISLAGPVSLWCALQCAMERAGLSGALSRLLRPVLGRLFPDSAADPEACAAISQNLSANLLGLGNAATPMGVRAVARMRVLSGSDRATNEMCRLIVMNTASIQLFPATVAALRASLGAPAPYAIVPAVWLCSALSVTAGLLAARLLEGRG